MKIGIVTVQDSNNFGSFLQAYALQHVLETLGHEVFFIRSRSKKYVKHLFYHDIPTKHDIKYLKKFLIHNLLGRKKYNKFRVQQKCFKVIDRFDPMLDMVILGSDEIWNTQTPVFRNEIFYGVGMQNTMAYAVSIGNASFEDMECIDEKCFKNIMPILVRDKHTAAYLKMKNIEAPIVCDPTFLVDPKIFKRDYNSELLNGSPFILIYSYGLEKQIIDALQAFAKQKRLRILSACFPFEWCDGTFDCMALDFCSVLEKAQYVFTSTFHGTIFSILMHKRFISFPQSRKTSDLLNSLNLDDRIIMGNECDCKNIERKLVLEEINYIRTDAYINTLKENSLKLLVEGLKAYEK